jgi:8-oxo-dGTP diphosphatase
MPTYTYPRPALTADIAVFRGPSDARELLLVRRGDDPFKGMWALPGGFVDEDEVLERAARRELAEETGLRPEGGLTLVGAYGDPGRDPRGWTVTILYAVVLAAGERDAVTGGDDAAEAAWHPVGSLPPLAFDHALLAGDAMAATASL